MSSNQLARGHSNERVHVRRGCCRCACSFAVLAALWWFPHPTAGVCNFLTRPLVCAGIPFLAGVAYICTQFWHTESTTCSAGNNWSKKDFSILPTFTDKLCQKLKFRGLKFGRSGFPQWMFWAASCKPQPTGIFVKRGHLLRTLGIR